MYFVICREKEGVMPFLLSMSTVGSWIVGKVAEAYGADKETKKALSTETALVADITTCNRNGGCYWKNPSCH